MLNKKYLCQSCYQQNSITVDMSYCSETVDLIEDCQICCNPNTISYTVENDKIEYFEVIKTY
jgi:hypothetical protein